MSAAPAANPAAPDGTSMECDVIIVGSGPSGMAAAALLGRSWRVVMVERHPSPYGLPRAGHIDHEILRILQGVGAHQPLLDDGVTNEVYRWVNGDGKLLLSFPIAESISGFPSDVMIYQPVLEDALRASIARHGDRVQTLMGWEAGTVRQDAHGISLDIQQRPGGGASRQLRGRYLLAADGARSTVREQLGLTQTDIGFSEDWLDVDVRLRRPLTRDIDGQFCDPARPTYIGALGRRHHRFEFARLPHETWAELEEPETAWKLMAAHGITPDDVEIVRQVVYRFEAKVADRWRRGRAFLVGDSAHTMPPHFGQGLCSGVRDAATISWKLDLVLRGAAADAFLDTYEQERHPHAEAWVDASVRVGRISCTLDAAAAARRDAEILSGAAPSFHPPQLDTGVLQQGAPAGGHPAPPIGQLSPQGRVSDGAASGLFHDLAGHGFILLGRGADPAGLLDDDTRRAVQRFRVTMLQLSAGPAADGPARLIDLDGTYTGFLDAHDADAVLIRPDYYVFGVTGRGGDPTRLLRQLDDQVPAAGPGTAPQATASDAESGSPP